MIGADLAGADLEGRVASWAAGRCRSSQEGAAPASNEPATRIPASACGRRARRGSGYADI